MEILLWLVPAALATGVAMLVAGWVGREEVAAEASQVPAPGGTELLPRPDEGVSAARPMRRAPADDAADDAVDTHGTALPDVRRSAPQPAAVRRTA